MIRKIERPYFKRLPVLRASVSRPWTVEALCTSYGWPMKGLPGGGMIGIVELGGGWRWEDMNQFFPAGALPEIYDISVDGTKNSHQRPNSDADVEVALDIQVAAMGYYLATGKPAKVQVYWAQDIGQAVKAAAKDGCNTVSISWGADEAMWGSEACKEMEAVVEAATAAGTTVFAAAGDNDSSDGGSTPANVDCPGSCPHVVCCGGTSKPRDGEEVVWNNNPWNADGSGTGGGYSTVFDSQSFQIGAPTDPDPQPVSLNGRMVPDVVANADPETGYEIVVYGQTQVIGGTSAVAPLYAGLFAAIGKKPGFISPQLWALANRSAFTDIVKGNNGVYSAAVGPDPCSGVGVMRAAELVKVFL